MTENKINIIGILAFGSLIDNPGQEISEIETERIVCETPFNVEFARTSSTRGNAPTLIPVEIGGQKVKAVIIVLNPETNIDTAKSILWRRELHKANRTENYIHSDNPSPNKVVVKTWTDFMNVQTVLYTSIGCNISQPLTSELLADFSINSMLTQAGQEEKDGLRYLLSAKRNGIVTTLSEDYENQILIKTETKSLEQAIEKLDRKRMMYPAEQ
jgi:cation transport regulator ChaC